MTLVDRRLIKRYTLKIKVLFKEGHIKYPSCYMRKITVKYGDGLNTYSCGQKIRTIRPFQEWKR